MALRQQLAFARRYARSAVVNRRTQAPPVLPAPHHPHPAAWPNDRLTAAWLGHATVLLNFRGTWLLTDPALERRIGIGRGCAKLGPRRLVQPALGARDLPPLDAVLLSHAHMDHTDLGTLARLPRNTHVVVQPGNRDRFAGSVASTSWPGETRRRSGTCGWSRSKCDTGERG
jgi:glyoxylase-like metal-dependent hydrolase (beta-lactamase superfamily II)